MDALLACVEAAGATLIVATHDLAMAEHLATSWSVKDGRLRTGVVPCSA